MTFAYIYNFHFHFSLAWRLREGFGGLLGLMGGGGFNVFTTGHSLQAACILWAQ